MLRIIFFVQVFIFLFFSSPNAAGSGRDTSAELSRKKILIIPYEPRMHLSDADLDISEYSERSPNQVRSLFRIGIAENLNTKLQASYLTHSLLQDLRPEAMQDINRIYASIDYSYDTSYAILHPRPDSIASKSKWNQNKARKKELEKRSLSGDVRYMNIKVLDPGLLSSLNKKYGADVIVFLTQVEIKTRSKDCIDFQSGIYQRDIKVHYAVFDSNGEQIFGDVAVVSFPSGSNEVEEIISRNFPLLGEQIQYGACRN